MTGATAQVKPLEESVFIEASQEAAWNALTQTSGPQPFYFDSVLTSGMRPGEPLEYRSPSGNATYIMGKVEEVSPPNRWVHAFRFTDLNEPFTRVTFAFKPQGKGTVVTVIHEELEKAPKTAKRVSTGWKRILGNLKTYLESGKLPFTTRLQYRLMNAILPLMMKKGAGKT